MRLSIVMPARNCQQTIAAAIKAVLAEIGDQAELLVLDDASEDNTRQVIGTFSHPSLHPVFLDLWQGPAKVRNYGMKLAQTDIILFVDADVVVQSGWYKRLIDDFRNQEIIGVQGLYTVSELTDDLVTAFQNDYYHYYFKSNQHTYTAIAATFCFAVRKEFFQRCGGFDEQVPEPTVEDEELGYRLASHGNLILLDKAISVRHLATYDFKSFSRRKVRMARSQIKGLLRRRANRALKTMITTRENKTHHPVTVLLSIPAALILTLSWLLVPIYPVSSLLVITGSSFFFFCCNIRFWRFFLRRRRFRLYPKIMLLTLADQLLLAYGVITGTLQFLIGKKY